MSFEIGKEFNGGAEWICNSSVIYGVIRNPVFTALLITALSLIIIHVMYKKDLKGTGWRRGFKTGFWLVIGVSALVFVHYYALERSLQKSHASQGVRNVMESIHHSATTGGGYVVYPDASSINDNDALGTTTGSAQPTPPSSPRRLFRPNNLASSSETDDLGLEEVVLTSIV